MEAVLCVRVGTGCSPHKDGDTQVSRPLEAKSVLQLSVALLAAGVPHVEIDGAFHRTDMPTKRRDKRRAAHARRLGYRIIRFPTEEVFSDTMSVVRHIQKELSSR